MAVRTIKVRFQVAARTEADWLADNPILLGAERSREFGLETDTGRVRFGDGEAEWADSPYVTALPPVGLWGDIFVDEVSPEVVAIRDGAVTNPKLAAMFSGRIKGRFSGGAGTPEDLTGGLVTLLLTQFTSSLQGVVPPPGAATGAFLRGDGAWVIPPAVAVQEPPANASAAGAPGTIVFDTSYLYVCIAANTWKRVALASW